MTTTDVPATRAPKPPALTTANSVILRLAERHGVASDALLSTVKATLMPSGVQVSDQQLMAFLMVADQYKLNPFVKQIYAFPAKGGGIQPIVGIDGWLAIMNGHPEFDGIEYSDQFDPDDPERLVAITAKVYRKDRKHPVEATEYMAECSRNTEPWKQWPRRMLRHKATIQAARAAFSLSGIMDPDEGERFRDVECKVVGRPADQPRGMKALEAAVSDPSLPDPRPADVDAGDASEPVVED